MKKSRSRKSNIRSIEVKEKQPLSLPTGNESSPSVSPSQGAPKVGVEAWMEEYHQYLQDLKAMSKE